MLYSDFTVHGYHEIHNIINKIYTVEIRTARNMLLGESCGMRGSSSAGVPFGTQCKGRWQCWLPGWLLWTRNNISILLHCYLKERAYITSFIPTDNPHVGHTEWCSFNLNNGPKVASSEETHSGRTLLTLGCNVMPSVLPIKKVLLRHLTLLFKNVILRTPAFTTRT